MRQNRAEFPRGIFGTPEAKICQRTKVGWNKLGRGTELEGLYPIKGTQSGIGLTNT
jgi:hypothetical protein